MKRTPLLVLLIFGVIATALVVAQTLPNPPGPPNPQDRAQHRVQFLTTLLSLNAAQQQQATTIFTNAANSATTAHDSVRNARQTLATAVKNNDSGAIDQAAATIGNLMAQNIGNEAKAKAAFYQILTADQRAKLDQFESQRPGAGRMGPGMGPGMMGMGPRH